MCSLSKGRLLKGRLTREEEQIFFELGGSMSQEIWFTPIILIINLVKLLKKQGVIKNEQIP